MKYEIRKMQQGGGFATFTPILESAPTTPTASGAKSTSKESSEDDSSNLLTKNLYSKLIGNGLVNDVNYFVDKIEALGGGLTSFTNQSTINSSLELIKDFNRVITSKQLWDSTYKNAQELGGLGEVAVSKQGGLFVKDGSTFKEVSIQDFNKHKDKYNPMTVAELLRARRNDPNLIYNDEVLQVGETAFGTNKILDNIQKSINLIGEYHKKSEKHFSRADLQSELQGLRMTKTPTEQQKQSISYLENLLSTPGEQYKVIQDIKSKKPYTNEAFSYIMSSLTREERNKLEAVAAINGTDAKTLIAREISSGLSGEEDISEISPEKIGAGEGAEKLTSKSNEELFLSGSLNRGETIKWNDKDVNNRALYLPTTGTISIMDGDKPFSMGTMTQLAKTNISQYLNMNKATFGGKRISLNDMDKIVSEGTLHRVFIPTNGDGTPNFTLLKDFQNAEKEANAHPEWSPEQVNDFYYNRGLGYVTVDADKNINITGNIKPYAITYGYTTGKADVTSNNDNAVELSGDEKNDVNKALTNVYKAAKVTPPTGWFNMFDDYYKGMIAIPIDEDASTKASANKGNVYDKKITLNTIEENMAAKPIPQGTSQLLNSK